MGTSSTAAPHEQTQGQMSARRLVSSIPQRHLHLPRDGTSIHRNDDAAYAYLPSCMSHPTFPRVSMPSNNNKQAALFASGAPAQRLT